MERIANKNPDDRLPYMFELFEQGHDLWFLNVRAQMYSREHLWLNPATEQAYWDWSFEELGRYDLVAAT